MLITIEGRPISKKNSRRNFGHVSLPSEAYCKFEKEALKQLKDVKEKHTGPMSVSYSFFMKGRLDSDIDNMIAGVNDILQKAGIIDDDKNIQEIEAVKWAENKDWRTEITITSLNWE